MATSTFERKIEITNPDAIARLTRVMSDETPRNPIYRRPFSREERDRSEALLKQCPLRSQR